MGRRDRTRIIADILELTCEPKRITDILVVVGFRGGYYTRYIRYLESKGLLTKTGKKKYVTSKKGKKWLEHYRAMKKLEGEAYGD